MFNAAENGVTLLTHTKEINMSTFAFAGVSTLEGITKFRVANDAARVKVLAKNGHKDIDIIQLKDPMTKDEAVAFLISIDFATRDGVTNETVRAALEAELGKQEVKAGNRDKPGKEAKKPKKEKTAPVKKLSLEGIRSKKEKVVVVDEAMAALTAGMTAMVAKPKSTLTKAEIQAQLDELDDAPF